MSAGLHERLAHRIHACWSANSRQARSWLVKAPMPRSMPGRLRPLRDATRRPQPLGSSRRGCNALDDELHQASFRNRRSPGLTSAAAGQSSSTPLLATDDILAVRVNASPERSSIGSGRSCETHFRPGGRHDRHRRPGLLGGTEAGDHLAVFGEFAVEKLSRAMFRPGADQSLEHLRRLGGRTDRGHDLGLVSAMA